jgi:HEAT repeat protein
MTAPPEGAHIYEIMGAIDAVQAEAAAGRDPGDVAWVIKMLDHVDDWVVATAAAAMGPLGLRGTIPRLIKLAAYSRDESHDLSSPGQAYAAAVVSMEYVEVRLAAVRSLGALMAPGDDAARSALQETAGHDGEHTSVRSAAREALGLPPATG